MRRFFSRLAVYFGLKEDDEPPPAPSEPPSKLRIAVAYVLAGLLAGFVSELAYLIFDGESIKASTVGYKAAVFCGILVVIRIAQHVASRSSQTTNGEPPSRA